MKLSCGSRTKSNTLSCRKVNFSFATPVGRESDVPILPDTSKATSTLASDLVSRNVWLAGSMKTVPRMA